VGEPYDLLLPSRGGAPPPAGAAGASCQLALRAAADVHHDEDDHEHSRLGPVTSTIIRTIGHDDAVDGEHER